MVVVVDRADRFCGRAVVVVDRQICESRWWIVVVNVGFVDRGRGSWSFCSNVEVAAWDRDVHRGLDHGSWQRS